MKEDLDASLDNKILMQVSIRVVANFDELKPTQSALPKLLNRGKSLLSVDSDVNKRIFIEYPGVITANFKPNTANLMSALFIGYIDKLRKKRKEQAIQLLQGFSKCYTCNTPPSGNVFRLFGVELNKTRNLSHTDSQKVKVITSVLGNLIKQIEINQQDLNELTLKDKTTLIAGIKYLIEDGINNLQKEKEELNKGSKEEIKNSNGKENINDGAIINHEIINDKLKLFSELFYCKITLFTLKEQQFERIVIEPNEFFNRVCSIHFLYDFNEENYKEDKTLDKALTAFLYRQPVSKECYDKLHRSKGLSPVKNQSELQPEFLYLETRDMQLLRRATTFAVGTYKFLKELVEKKATYSQLKNLTNIMKNTEKFMLNSEIEELKNEIKEIQECQELLKDEDLVGKTIFAKELVTTKRGNCVNCNNENVKLIQDVATCSDKLNHCLCCMKKDGEYRCPICKVELTDDIVGLMLQGNCAFCGHKIVVLSCGDCADTGCLKEQMLKAKKERRGYEGIICKNHNKEVGFEVLSQIDSELSATLSLNEFINAYI